MSDSSQIKDKSRCLGREIDPTFRENYCGKKRFTPKDGFPCEICDLNSANKKESSK